MCITLSAPVEWKEGVEEDQVYGKRDERGNKNGLQVLLVRAYSNHEGGRAGGKTDFNKVRDHDRSRRQDASEDDSFAQVESEP